MLWKPKEITVEDDIYHVGESLGKGKVGKAFIAENSNGQQVTVKTITQDWAVQSIEHAMEIRANHPGLPEENLVKFLPGGAIKRGGHVITTYAPGNSLDKLDLDPKWSAERVNRITSLVRNTLHSLGFLESAGIVHRDIKPENLVLSSDASKVTIIDPDLLVTDHGTDVADFGGVGSLPIMAPEMYNRYSCNATTKADMFALGVTTIRLLYGFRVMSAYRRKYPLESPGVLRQRSRKFPESVSTVVSKLVEFIIESTNFHSQDRPNVETALRMLS